MEFVEELAEVLQLFCQIFHSIYLWEIERKWKQTGNSAIVCTVVALGCLGQDQHDGVCWALKRGEQTIGPVFSTWTHDLARIDGLCMPWLDSPGKAGLDCEYSVQCRLRGTAQLLGHFGLLRELRGLTVWDKKATHIRAPMEILHRLRWLCSYVALFHHIFITAEPAEAFATGWTSPTSCPKATKCTGKLGNDF